MSCVVPVGGREGDGAREMSVERPSPACAEIFLNLRITCCCRMKHSPAFIDQETQCGKYSLEIKQLQIPELGFCFHEDRGHIPCLGPESCSRKIYAESRTGGMD